jgi:hypothetical protein
MFLLAAEHLTDIKQAVIMENKFYDCVTFTVPKITSDIGFMICDQYESSTFGKLKFVKKIIYFPMLRVQHIIFCFPQ